LDIVTVYANMNVYTLYVNPAFAAKSNKPLLLLLLLLQVCNGNIENVTRAIAKVSGHI